MGENVAEMNTLKFLEVNLLGFTESQIIKS